MNVIFYFQGISQFIHKEKYVKEILSDFLLEILEHIF